MLAFALPGFVPHLPRGTARVGRLAVQRFANQELTLHLGTNVAGQPCAVIGSVAPPDEQLLALSLAADTLVRHGAAVVTAVLPYLGYARQDRPEPGAGLGIAWVGGLLSASGVERVVTIDVHSPRAGDLLGLPLTSLSPAALFATELGRAGLLDAVVVAPDEGALERCRAVAVAAGITKPVACLRKERTPSGVVHGELLGSLGPSAVVVDDILDTGGTLISCCRELQRRGVAEIAVMVTHGLFTGDGWRTLPSVGVRRIYVTDSVPPATRFAAEGVRLISVQALIEHAMTGI